MASRRRSPLQARADRQAETEARLRRNVRMTQAISTLVDYLDEVNNAPPSVHVVDDVAALNRLRYQEAGAIAVTLSRRSIYRLGEERWARIPSQEWGQEQGAIFTDDDFRELQGIERIRPTGVMQEEPVLLPKRQKPRRNPKSPSIEVKHESRRKVRLRR